MSIGRILKHKGSDVARVAAGATIGEVVAVLAARRIGAVLVLNHASHILGIVSERDVVQALARHGSATLQMTASQIMTHAVTTATPHTTVAEAMELMTKGRFRHLPVVESGVLVGIVSIGDIVKARISDTEYEVDSLRAYVAGAA
jgi:CBS domain-containing protein